MERELATVPHENPNATAGQTMDFGRTMCAGDLGVPMIDLETLPADKQDLV
jgi:hypothetical protein